MIGYHPALDAHHAAFRLLRLLSARSQGTSEATLKILDFFLLFPEAIANVRLPREHVTWRGRLRRPVNPYWFDGDRALVFQRMSAVQDAALGMLTAAGWVSRDPSRTEALTLGSVDVSVNERLEKANAEDAELVEFLVTVLAPIAVGGDGGLKDRTGLLEHRYDAT